MRGKVKTYVVFFIFFSITSLATVFALTNEEAGFDKEELVEVQQTLEPEIVSAESRLLFTGEVYWGRQYERKRRNSEADALTLPFSGLDTYDKDNYDSWIAHLECPITDAELSFQDEWDAVALNCRPEFLPEFLKWYEIGTIGHNHIFDIEGESGYEETKQNLDQVGFKYF